MAFFDSFKKTEICFFSFLKRQQFILLQICSEKKRKKKIYLK